MNDFNDFIEKSEDNDPHSQLRINEAQFFEGEYNYRKFLIDKDVICYDEIPEEIKKLNVFNDLINIHNTGQDVLSYANNLIQHIFTEIKKLGISLDEDEKLKFQEACLDILQINFIKNKLNIDLDFYYENYNNSDKYFLYVFLQSLFDYNHQDIIKKLCAVSMRYGLFISDLISEIPTDDYLKNIDNDHLYLKHSKMFVRYKDMIMNDDIKIFASEKKEKESKKIKDFINGERHDTSSYKLAFKEAFKSYGGYYRNSKEPRILGLWLWDKVKNPYLKYEKKFPEAKKELIKNFNNIVKAPSIDDENTRVKLYEYMKYTDKCIKEGKILRIKWGK